MPSLAIATTLCARNVADMQSWDEMLYGAMEFRPLDTAPEARVEVAGSE